MKIRTDFVTNSSSSSFVLEIHFNLKNGNYISFYADGGTGETGRVNYFDSDAIVNVSPKQLGTAKNVEEMIQLLTDGVLDGNWWGEQTKIFEKSNPVKSDIGAEVYDAYDFIKSIRRTIGSMDDIESVRITGDEHNYTEYLRTFSYNCVSGEYTGTVVGDEFEKDGSSGGDLRFSTEGCKIEYSEADDCDEDDFLY